jgi:hypothetical protein
MDLFDTLAFLGRRYERQAVPGSVSERFTMSDVLRLFDRAGILELTPYTDDHARTTVRPDAVRKIKVTLLDDGLSAIHSTTGDWFEVFRTAPSGDLSKVRIVAHAPAGNRVGEIRMLVGRRSFEHYFEQDPILETIARRQD